MSTLPVTVECLRQITPMMVGLQGNKWWTESQIETSQILKDVGINQTREVRWKTQTREKSKRTVRISCPLPDGFSWFYLLSVLKIIQFCSAKLVENPLRNAHKTIRSLHLERRHLHHPDFHIPSSGWMLHCIPCFAMCLLFSFTELVVLFKSECTEPLAADEIIRLQRITSI